MEVSALVAKKKNVFGDQEVIEDRVQLESFLLQICINVVLAIIMFFTFCFLRSKHPAVYESKRDTKSEVIQRPEPLKQGCFFWIYATFKLTDGDLLQYSNFDGFTFVYYLRTLRKLVTILTLICVSVLLPLNVVASYNSGIWPPSPGLSFLTLSNVNYPDHGTYSDVWFWCPSVACWLFSVIVVAQMFHSSNCFLITREKYCTTLKKSSSAIESLIARTLLIRVDRISQGDEKIKYVIDHFSNATCQKIVFGQYNERTAYLVNEYNKLIYKVETEAKRKEQVSFLSLFLKKRSSNRIEHYKSQIESLERSIGRSLGQLQNANYLFAVYTDRETAFKAYNSLRAKKKEKHPLIYNVSFAPCPKDIIWSSMHLDTDSFRLKRRFGYALFASFLFVAMIPIGVIAAFSNLINLLRMCRKPLGSYRVIMDLVQSYFAPWFMFILFAIGIRVLRYISRQQACKTESGIVQSTIFKAYVFFIVDHLLAFTTFNSMIGIMGQMVEMSPSIGLSNLMVSNYIYQIGKNAASSSIYWISYTCINIIGLFFSFLRPSALILKKKEALEDFEFSRNYALIIALFTSTLVYSVTAPIVLPFSFIYFGAATIVFKYELVYMYRVKVDTYGRIWPMLYFVTVISVIVFQLIMIATIRLKGGWIQVYSLVPLPILTSITLIYTQVISRRMSLSAGWLEETEDPLSLQKIEEVFRDPILSKTSETETPGPSDTKNSILNMPYNPYFEAAIENNLDISVEPAIEASAPDMSALVNTEKTAF